MQQYLDLMQDILDHGALQRNRTGVETYVVTNRQIRHDMVDGFPLLTTRKMPFPQVRVEIQGYIHGITDKKWYQDRKCTFWDDWANPKKAPSGDDEVSRARMREERDLGPIYGWAWRYFGAEYKGFDHDYTGQGVDQLTEVINQIRKNPFDRRMIINSWDARVLDQMAIPPCPYSLQFDYVGDRLNLYWTQRSTDSAIGLPNDMAGYALLLSLVAEETGFEVGELVGTLGNTHIYANHKKGVEEQLLREPRELPELTTKGFESLFKWSRDQSKIIGYNPHPIIDFPRAV